MELRQAANYFSNTEIYGWKGRSWVPLDHPVTLLPYDRFISEREFGNKRRHLLVDPDFKEIDKYSVIRLEPEKLIYLVGDRNFDMQESDYSRVQLIHRAPLMGEVFGFTAEVMASGVGGKLTPVSKGRWHCDIERVTFANSQEFDDVSFSSVSLFLPRDCPIDTDCEINIDDRVYDLREVYQASGLTVCRAFVKHPATVTP